MSRSPKTKQKKLPNSAYASLGGIQGRLLKAQNELRAQHQRVAEFQRNLQASKERYADLFDFAPVGYVTLTASGIIQEINSTAATILNESAAAARKSPFARFVRRSDRGVLTHHLLQCRQARRVVTELYLAPRNRVAFPVQLITAPSRKKGGQRSEFHTSVIDLTELKLAHAALERSKIELEIKVKERTEELRKANAILQKEITQRNRLETALVDISERERRSFGQNLHDETCQVLAGLSLSLEVVARELKQGRPGSDTSLHEVSENLRLLVDSTRRIARGLHPISLASGGLNAGLAELVEHVDKKIPCRLITDEVTVPDQIAEALYRIAQEATTNALKHARATKISVKLKRTKRQLVLEVTDDGIGFSPMDQESRGMGLSIMGYRANIMGAQLAITGGAQGGTCVSCVLSDFANIAPRSGV